MDTVHQFLDVGTSFKQVEEAIKEEMEKRSCKAWSDGFATDVDSQEHNILHHRYYEWLREEKQENIERKILRLCAPARQRAVKLAIDNLLRVKIEALIVAISIVRWRLRTVGAERELFSRSGVITSLVSRLDEGTQTRWYLHLTKDLRNSKEDAFIQ